MFEPIGHRGHQSTPAATECSRGAFIGHLRADTSVTTPPPEHADEFRSHLLSWGVDNQRNFLWRDPDRSFYEVFVAEFFLTQTQANNVAEVYPTFLERFPSLVAIAQADPDEIESTIEPLGFQRMRTDALIKIADQYSTPPRDRDDLTDLPRVGPYVADATLCFACERPLPIVDRNVVRIYNRVFDSDFPDSESNQRAFATQMLPGDGSEARRYNLALLDFGALLCQKLDPKCETCVASEYCRYYNSSAKK